MLLNQLSFMIQPQLLHRCPEDSLLYLKLNEISLRETRTICISSYGTWRSFLFMIWIQFCIYILKKSFCFADDGTFAIQFTLSGHSRQTMVLVLISWIFHFNLNFFFLWLTYRILSSHIMYVNKLKGLEVTKEDHIAQMP